MAHAARCHERGDVIRGNQPGRQILAVVQFERVIQLALLHDHHVAAVVHDGGIREAIRQQSPADALVARLLPEFPQARRHRVRFMWIHHPAGHFQFHRVRAVTVLLHHDQALVLRDRQYVHPVHRLDHVKVVLTAGARALLDVGTQVENAEVAHRTGGERRPGLDRVGHGVGRRAEGGGRSRGACRKCNCPTVYVSDGVAPN